MDSSEEENQMTYEVAMDSGLLDSYSEAQQNGLLHHYETALECGDVGIQTKEDVSNIFGITMGRYKKSLSEIKTKPEFYMYRAFNFKRKKLIEVHALKIEIEALRRSHEEYREKYYDLKERCEK